MNTKPIHGLGIFSSVFQNLNAEKKTNQIMENN